MLLQHIWKKSHFGPKFDGISGRHILNLSCFRPALDGPKTHQTYFWAKIDLGRNEICLKLTESD